MMRWCGCLLLLIATLLLIKSVSAQYGESSIELTRKQSIQTTLLEYRLVRSGDNTLNITSLKIKPGRYAFRLAFPKNLEAGGWSLSRFRHENKALAVFTGSFLGTFSPPTPAGLVSQQQRVLNELRPKDPIMKAVICYSADSRNPIRIVNAVGFNDKSSSDCTQAGPYLVKDGLLETDFDALDGRLRAPFSREPFDRIFVLLDAQDNVVVGIAQKISLVNLAKILRKSPKENGFGATIAIALSGAQTAGLAITNSDGSEISVGSVKTLLPNAVVVYAR